MAKEEYEPVNQQEADELHGEGVVPEGRYAHSRPRIRTKPWICLVIGFLVLSNIAFIILFYRHIPPHDKTPPKYAIPHKVPTQYRQFWWNTGYSSTNRTLQDELWDSIIWTHGMIAVDRRWAKSQNWAETMGLPADEGRDVYLLEAYHEVHCLKVLRNYMSESLAGHDFSNQPSTHAHIAHCFDYLLQVVICNADSTPLNLFGGTVVGQGHIHKCKNWSSLRSFAADHSACYTEVEGVSLKEKFGHCDNGDGLRLGMLQDLKVD